MGTGRLFRATNKDDCVKAMNNIMKVDEDTSNKLWKINPKYCLVYIFDKLVKCDLTTNNIIESWNWKYEKDTNNHLNGAYKKENNTCNYRMKDGMLEIVN